MKTYFTVQHKKGKECYGVYDTYAGANQARFSFTNPDHYQVIEKNYVSEVPRNFDNYS